MLLLQSRSAWFRSLPLFLLCAGEAGLGSCCSHCCGALVRVCPCTKVAVCTHLLAWGLWMGSNIWTTFAVGITMFKNMPRQMFGRVQAKLFPAVTLQQPQLLWCSRWALWPSV